MAAVQNNCALVLLLLLLFSCATPSVLSKHDAGLDPRCSKGQYHVERVSVVVSSATQEFQIVEGRWAAGAVANASWIDSAATLSNFGQLRVATSVAFADADQAFAAGVAEGWLTAARIWDHLRNTRAYFRGSLNLTGDGPVDWLERQDAWARQQVAAAAAADGGSAPSGEQQDGVPRGYWPAVGLALTQFDGVVEGYRRRAAAEGGAAAAGDGSDTRGALGTLTKRDFLFLNGNGELYDVMEKREEGSPSDAGTSKQRGDEEGRAGGGRRPTMLERYAAMGPDELFVELAAGGRCSALIKVAHDLSDIFMAHSTWDTFTAALRVYKHYTLPYRGDGTALLLPPPPSPAHTGPDSSAAAAGPGEPVRALTGRERGAAGAAWAAAAAAAAANYSARSVSFSSYPGELFSDDDLYLLDSGLVVLQTTNKIFNASLYDAITHESVVSWQRVRAANLLAPDGETWARVLKAHNSGTYNNQYMVLDLKRFEPRRQLLPGLLWVVEQIPGLVEAADLTHALWLGFWPSFNVPYFASIYEASGYPDFTNRTSHRGRDFGEPVNWLSQVASPRAMQFRRDQGSVDSLAGLKALMRYDDYKNDPLSRGHPLAAVCGRADLAAKGAIPKGCFDTKVTSYRMALRLEAEAVNGPTTSHGLPPFSWADPRWAALDLEHHGHPRVFDFDFELQAPDLASAACVAASDLDDDGGDAAGDDDAQPEGPEGSSMQAAAAA